jgi:transcriptional regulator with XRE-family HTH domain
VEAYDERLGRLFHLLRTRTGLTQEELAVATQIPVRDISRLETGHCGLVLFERIRRLFLEVEARTRITVWWNGAAADRLLDERHADVLERAARVLSAFGWAVPTELSFNEYGERGSIDLFGHRRDAAAVLVGEVKSAIGSLEELNRTHDAKARLAPKLCRDRFGWTPRFVGRVLIVPDESTIRRVIAAHHQTMHGVYPARSREVRTWLKQPNRTIGGIWFLSNPRARRTGSASSGANADLPR